MRLKSHFEVIQKAFPIILFWVKRREKLQRQWYQVDHWPDWRHHQLASGIPICCVSIGVEKTAKWYWVQYTIPLSMNCSSQKKGKGATLNGNKISVSSKKEVLHSCLVTGFPYTYPWPGKRAIADFEKLIRRACRCAARQCRNRSLLGPAAVLMVLRT